MFLSRRPTRTWTSTRPLHPLSRAPCPYRTERQFRYAVRGTGGACPRPGSNGKQCLPSVIIAAAAPVRWISYEVADRNQDDCADKRANQRDAININVTDARDNNDVCHQPDADQRGNNCANEAEWETPAYQSFRDETNNCCNN